ncbi:hypothetical protein KGQ19_20790 [Catenulispora sp. NL8]|uniref:Secreted protein n=1 Tax=Catenulispora pinistramenti TaxID=2705254 RepID=A0ABS5KTE0_9ACTN|nr:hypothetical protein [Catenulispora pinistramenti]MBS2549305.1 hypothetical protein [Catenulispora pinistramenti]
MRTRNRVAAVVLATGLGLFGVSSAAQAVTAAPATGFCSGSPGGSTYIGHCYGYATGSWFQSYAHCSNGITAIGGLAPADGAGGFSYASCGSATAQYGWNQVT